MIEHNSEVHNDPYRDLLPYTHVYMYNEKRYVLNGSGEVYKRTVLTMAQVNREQNKTGATSW